MKDIEIYSIKRINDFFEIIDQTLLPLEEKYITISDYKEMIYAIQTLQIRGAPAIGIAAVAAAFLAFKSLINETIWTEASSAATILKMYDIIKEIEQSRATAVNLFFATEKIKNILLKNKDIQTIYDELSHLVDELMSYEYNACRKMAENGVSFIPDNITKILTHCNTGSLATYGIGTALGVIKTMALNREIEVYVDETRPLLQGSRLTMWELYKANINNTLITDNMAAWTIKNKGVQAVITGADRIAKNGDTANKIGTFNLAILAKYFQIPFYIIAPESTIDRNILSGNEMIIEERNRAEVTHIKDVSLTINNPNVFNPSFDITPAGLITAIITEKKVYDFSSNASQ